MYTRPNLIRPPMTKSKNRDDFSQATKNRLAKQARYHCSNPSCRKLTSAPTSDGSKEVNIGVAAHRSEGHTSELQSLMRISYAVFCLKKKILLISSTSCTLYTSMELY